MLPPKHSPVPTLWRFGRQKYCITVVSKSGVLRKQPGLDSQLRKTLHMQGTFMQLLGLIKWGSIWELFCLGMGISQFTLQLMEPSFWMGVSSTPLLIPQPQSCWKWGIHVGKQSVILGYTYGKELLQHTAWRWGAPSPTWSLESLRCLRWPCPGLPCPSSLWCTLMQTAVICHPRTLTTKQEFIPEGACYCPLPAGQWHKGSGKEEEKLTKRTVVFLPWGI